MRFGIVPSRRGGKESLAAALVAHAVSEASGEPCQPVIMRDPSELVARYAANELDFLWASPTLALSAPELADASTAAVSVRAGSPHYHGVFFVRRDSPYRTPLDLRGKSVAWVASTSASGYIFPRVGLVDLGLHPDELFKRQIFVGTHGNVAQMVLTGEVACGAGSVSYTHLTLPTTPYV